MRLFVAIRPPPDVVRDLIEAVGGTPVPTGPVRWVVEDQLHATLAFLGEVPTERQAEVERRLARVAERYAPLTLQLAGAGRFGDRVLFARITGDRAELGRLAASVAAAARRSGVELEDRPFRPHLTLARARPPAELRPLVAALADYRSAPWTTTGLELVASRLGAGPGGRSEHRTAATWPLTGRL